MLSDPLALREMLALNGGIRRVPVLMDPAKGEPVIGFNRGS